MADIRPVQVDESRPARVVPEVGRRRWLPVAAVIAGAVVVAIAGGTLLGQIPQAANDPPQIEYPVIDGELGTHLEQLQNSVAP